MKVPITAMMLIVAGCNATSDKDPEAVEPSEEPESTDGTAPDQDTATATDDTGSTMSDDPDPDDTGIPTPTDTAVPPTDDTGSTTTGDTGATDTASTELHDTSEAGFDTGTMHDTGSDVVPPEPLLDAPTLYGEVSAGHSTPTWLWTWSEEATVLQWKIDDGPWWSGDPSSDRVTAPEALSEGEHTVSITLSTATGSTSETGSFTTTIEYFERDGYWNGVERDFATSPLGHAMGIVCHNCYEEDESSPGGNLEESMAILDSAHAEEADLLEFDVRYYSGEWRLEHNDTPGSDAAYFEDMLAYEALHDWDQPLFIEIKERDPTPAAVQELLNLVLDAGFATNGRPVFFRAFQDERIDNLVYLNESLASGDHPLHEHYIRLHVLFADDTASDTSDFQALIHDAADAGFHGVNLNWKTPDLFNLLEYAKSLGLGTSTWTIPVSMGEAWCASLREDVDALVVDYDLSDCRQVVEEDTNLVYVNANHMGSDLELEWFKDGSERFTHTLGGPTDPVTITRTWGEGLFGTSLLFDADLNTAIGFYDADNDPASGFLLATTVEFDDLDLSYGETQAIFSKADAGGFALELHGGLLGTKLRFGVHVDGEYRYAERTLMGIDTGKSHFIMGSYDGEGRVRLWLNNSDTWVDETGVYSDGVTRNDTPVTLGADPEGAYGTRYYFSGRIQMAMLQNWRDH